MKRNKDRRGRRQRLITPPLHVMSSCGTRTSADRTDPNYSGRRPETGTEPRTSSSVVRPTSALSFCEVSDAGPAANSPSYTPQVVDWREKMRADQDRWPDDPGRCKAAVQTDWRLHCIENWIADAEQQLDALKQRRELLLHRRELLVLEGANGQQLLVEAETSLEVERLAHQLGVMKCG